MVIQEMFGLQGKNAVVIGGGGVLAGAMSLGLAQAGAQVAVLDIHKENAVPLVYLGKRYKIRALLEQAEVYVMENIVSTTAMYFLLDSYLFQLEEILSRSIDVTAANLEDTVDFEPIYKLPPELFKRVILSKELKFPNMIIYRVPLHTKWKFSFMKYARLNFLNISKI